MGINLEILRESLENNKDDMLGNRALTNELIVDDLMLELGYNKKRNKSVKRFFKGDIDWLVDKDTHKMLAIKTFAVGEKIFYAEIQGLLNKLLTDGVLVVLLTNGENIIVYAYNHLSKNYLMLTEISILEDLNDEQLKVMNTISHANISIDSIKNIIEQNYITEEKTCDWLCKHIDDIVKLINEQEKINDTERLKIVVNDILSGKTNRTENITVDNSNLADEIVKLNETVDKLTKDLSDKSLVAEELQSEIDTNTKTINDLQLEINNKNEELNNLQAKLDDKQKELEDLQVEFNKTSELREQELLNEKNNLLQNIDKLNREKDNHLKQISGITIQNQSLLKEIDELKGIIQDKDDNIDKLINDKTSLENKVSNLKNQVSQLTGNGVDQYIEQINNLSEEVEQLREENNNYVDKIKLLNNEIKELEGSERKKALELLDLIQVDESKPKQYVAVVNTKLFTTENLSKFIGQALQELSALKGSNAAPVIFDGDMFELEKHKTNEDTLRRDLSIGESIYQINVDGISDEEAINKLHVMFSNFDDVVFVYKIVGNIHNNTQIQEQTISKPIDARDNTEELDTVEELDTAEELNTVEENIKEEPKKVRINLGKTDIEQDKKIDNIKVTLDSVKLNKDYTSNVEVEHKENSDNNFVRPEPIHDESYLMAVQLLNYGSLVFSEGLDIKKISYIGTNCETYVINNEQDLDKIASKCIEAVTAIEVARGSTDIIRRLKSTNLSGINKYIVRANDNYPSYAKITATRFCIHGIKKYTDIITLVYDFCNTLKIDMNDIFIYVKATTPSQQIMDDFYYPENSVYLANNIDKNILNDNNVKYAVIKGDMLNNTIITEQSLDIHSKLIKTTLGVKTKILSKSVNALDNYNDMMEIIQTIITDAINIGIPHETICKCLTLDGKHKLVSTNPDEVRNASKSVYIGAGEFFISRLENWETTESIIRFHTTIYNTTSIAVKSVVSNEMVEFLNNGFSTSEPSLALAVLSFRNYINSTLID